MESAHHHLHQDHHLVGSSTLSTPCLSVGNTHSFPTNLLLDSSNIQSTSNSGEDLGCHSWMNNHLYLETKSNLESSTKFTDLLTSGNFSRLQQKDDDVSEKLMLKTLLLQSPNNYHVGSPFESMGSPNDVPMFSANVGTTLMNSQIHPSVNIPSLNGFHGISSMEDLNLQPLDLFSMDRSSPQTYSRLQNPLDPQNLPSLNNNNGPKRSSSKIVEPKATPQSISKRQRAESRSSCPPFKVRKEKLGDRIAALQQMVAPFGKTDTASVLMEAIGYIKFLQSQVETLSVPYMKLSSSNKSNNKTMQEGSCGKEDEADLRSGGLCLMPLSCMNYIANDAGLAGTWPSNPHNFNPGF